MKQLAAILLVFIVTGFSLPKEKGLIEYNEQRELTWNDYKARPNKASSFKALTASRISFSANSEGKLLKLNLQNYFEPHASWTKTDKNKELLEHERLHFHISELFARKLRRQILQTKFKSSGQRLMNEVSKMYEEHMHELTQCQRRYDRETDHSIQVDKQEEWDFKIKSELLTLKQFTNPSIEIELK